MPGELLDSQLQHTPPTGIISHCHIAGRLLSVHAHGEWTAQWVSGFLNGFHLVQTSAPLEDKSAVTLAIRRATPPLVPSGLQSFAVNHGDCYTDGTQYFLAVDESLVRSAEPSERLVEVWFGDTEHARNPIALVNAFSYGLQAALRRAGVFDVHAAAAVEPISGAGALFVGASGSGKTTLTLRLTEAGWRYLSDDMVVLRETNGVITAEGLRRLFAVSSTSIVGTSQTKIDAALGSPVASDPNKRRLEPETVFPDSRAASCRPHTLFFPRIVDETQTRISGMTSREAMQQLMRHCPWATYDAFAAPDYLKMLAQLASQCRAYELLAGRDLLLEPERSADLLAPYMSE